MSFSQCGSVLAGSLTSRALRIRQIANEMLTLYGLEDWTFTYNRRKTEMGLCLYSPKRIELSQYFIELNGDEAVRETLLHEIAHALVGPGHGHDLFWKQQCLKIGAKPERLCHSVSMPEGRWGAQCGYCGMLHYKHRKPKHMVGWFCSRCGRERGRLTWRRVSSDIE
jgi:predicted SprT family Zn-dependent metalloprotease